MIKLTTLAALLAISGSSVVLADPACCSGDGDVPACCMTLPQQGLAEVAQLASPTSAESSQSKTLVAAYEKLSSALFDGEMDRIREEAAALAEVADEAKLPQIAEDSRAIGETANAEAARKAFTKLSASVIAVVENEPGYYIMNCPMVKNGLWLQSSKDLHNPYMGERMPRCGMLKRQTGSSK